MCTVPTFQDSSCSSLGAGQPAGRTDRETRVGCSMDSWCELSESCKWVHWVYCEVYCLSKHEGVTDTPSFYWVCVSGGCSLGSMGGWRSHGICIREAPPCTAVTPTSNCALKEFDALTKPESSLITPAPCQNSRCTPRCPSVVLWTPCSGVEWVRSNRTSRAGGTTRKQPANLAVKSAEESLSILPDNTPTVRPPPSAVDHLGETCCNVDLLSHCHRRRYGVRCALVDR